MIGTTQEVLMPLSDLFKKSSKKDTNQPKANTAKPWMDNPLASKDVQKKRYDAAMEFLTLFQQRMPPVDGKPHPGTVLSTVARLAGTSLFRAVHSNKEFPAGNFILSEGVNEAYPQLLNLFAVYCKQNGLDVMAKPTVTTFPENDKPLMTLEQTRAEYQKTYNEVMQKHGLDDLEGARAGMVVCSMIFQYHCIRSKDIDPYVATGIVAMGIVEGAKTAPQPLGAKSPVSDQTEKKEENSNRLILGEQGDVLREAAANGGVHIVLNPGVLQALQQGGIDPYVIHEQGVKKQMDEKIPRIDFIQADVDALFNEWKGKSLDKAPEYVRLIFWLKDNASTHGYEQHGNSWLLK